MITKDNTFAVVVWYNPTPEQSRNIQSYAHHVRHVVVVDNSKKNNAVLLGTPDSWCTYLPLGDNKGIASALNIGCQEAIAQGAEWIMTMDQDSCWKEEQIMRYMQLANAYPMTEKVGVFSPRQDYQSHFRDYPDAYEEKIAVMTSGCLLSAAGYCKTGGFREELFIDEVDNEYCMHIRREGLKVVVINHAFLEHRLGELRNIRFLGLWSKEYIDHEPWRFYYMTRNNLLLSHWYPEYHHFNTQRLRKMLKRIVLYDRRHKLAALRMCWRGWRDFRKMCAIEQ